MRVCGCNVKSRHEPGRMLIFSTNALSLAIARDGSSGSIAGVAVITKHGMERKTVLNPELPKFFEN